MSFEIHPIGPSQENRTWAAVRHCQSEFHAWVRFPEGVDEARHHGRWNATLSWRSVIESTILNDFSDDDSYIGQCDTEKDEYIIQGRISNLTEDAKGNLVDVYILNGPEFVLFEQIELGSEEFSIGDGIQVKIKGLCLECVNVA